MSKTLLAAAAVASLTVGAFAWQKNDSLPAPYATPTVANAAKVIPRPDGTELKVPAGFSVKKYAEGFERPRFMVQGSGGEVLISDMMPSGSVFALKGGTKKALLSGLDRPYGLAFWKGYLYVAETTSLKRYKYDSKALTTGAGEEIVAMKDFGKGHVTRTVAFDRKGEKMYLSIGSSANVVTGDPEMRAAVNRFNPDGSGQEVYASGLRNPVGLRFYPGTDTLWTSVQERDGLGDGLVPDFFTSLRSGGFYGWPYTYIGSHPDPRIEQTHKDLADRAIVPDVPLESHVAVLDFLFYTAKQFPAEFRGGAFLANHGSSSRAKRVGYSISYVPFKAGKPSGPPQDFLTGWMLGEDKKEVWGRPVGLLQMGDGSLLVSDDGGKAIWRVSYGK